MRRLGVQVVVLKVRRLLVVLVLVPDAVPSTEQTDDALEEALEDDDPHHLPEGDQLKNNEIGKSNLKISNSGKVPE